MKKYLSFALAVVMMAMYLVFPVMATAQTDSEEEMMEINGVYIPVTATCEQEGTATVYYDFYDSVNDMHYAYYNTEPGEHFAMSGPRTEVFGEGARSVKVVAHEYSFDARFTVNGKNNGITFELPAQTVYLSGHADTRKMANNLITSYDYEDGYEYSIELRQDKFLFPQSATFSGIAGHAISGNVVAKGGTYYLIIHPESEFLYTDDIEGSGTLYYYE